MLSNDALRKHGILPPREPTPPTPPSPPSPTLDDLLEDFTPSELQELADGAGNDEEERTIAAYRRQRIAKLQREERKARFGRVYPIGRDDYTREVTEASKVNEAGEEEEKGTGVVCFLYKDGCVYAPFRAQGGALKFGVHAGFLGVTALSSTSGASHRVTHARNSFPS